MRIDSTLVQLQAFKSGLVNRDMMRELVDMRRRSYEEFDVVDDLVHLGKVQGRIEAINVLLGLPQMLIETKRETSSKIEPSMPDIIDGEEDL